MILSDNIFSASQTAAGATHPFFDDDLPEVTEPFLPPLEEGEEDVYTLVLDLDETLVHYFDVSHFTISWDQIVISSSGQDVLNSLTRWPNTMNL